MKKNLQADMVNASIEMRKYLTDSDFGLDELRRIYIARPVADYFKQDASLGGYVPHTRKLQKKNFFV
jgi:hypothetical protein